MQRLGAELTGYLTPSGSAGRSGGTTPRNERQTSAADGGSTVQISAADLETLDKGKHSMSINYLDTFNSYLNLVLKSVCSTVQISAADLETAQTSLNIINYVY